MELIFGKTDNQEVSELQKYFSHIPGTIQFDEISPDLEMAQEELALKFTGEEIIAEAVAHYWGDNYMMDTPGDTSGSGSDGYSEAELAQFAKLDTLVAKIRLCVCLMGYREFALNNDATHTKTGRTARMDKDTDEFQEKLIDRDDFAMQRKIQKAIDSLVLYIDRNGFTAWTTCSLYKQTRDLVLWNAETFHRFYNIEHSQRLFLLLISMVRSVQNDYVLPVIGTTRMTALLTAVKNNQIFNTNTSGSGSDSEDMNALYDKVASPIAYLAMSAGYKDLPIQLFPENMSRQFWNAGNGTAFLGLRDKVIAALKEEGMRKLAILERYIETLEAIETDTPITDDTITTIAERMDTANKFARV